MSKGVMRPGHIQIRVMDMDEAVCHYRDRMGLIEMDRDSSGRVYLKGWTEVDAYSVVLRPADEPGMDFMGFKVVSTEVMNQLKQELIDFGCQVEVIPAGELNDCGERVRFDSPTGHMFELYAEKKQTGKWGIHPKNPDAWPEELKGMRAQRFDHCLLYGDDLDGALDLFCNVLGFQLSEEVVDGELRVAQFISCSMKAHDLAWVRHPEKGKLHHASFYLETWGDVLRAADIISMHDMSLDIGPTRHGLTHGQTIYFFDPSGNRSEVFCGGDYTYPDHPVVTWDADQLGKAIFYHDRVLNERFFECFNLGLLMDIIQQASIDWASAHLACEAAMLQAQALSVHVSIAVVDRNGRTIAFLCDPLAPFHCSDIATDKAYTAASFGLPTHRWTEISQSMSVAVKEGLLQRDRMVMFGGGFPIVVDGERVGGIGVSGASETQDMECAVAALNKIGADKESV